MIDAVGRIHGWPATLTEPDLLDAPVVLRPVRVSDARAWREIRVRNASWLRPWEPSNPETPLHRSSIGPYVSMVRTMRREARQGIALPWVVSYGGHFAGQLTVGSVVWGSSRSGQIGYWIDESFAGQGDHPDRAGDGRRPLLPGDGHAPARGVHPAGERRVPAGGGEARVPRRGDPGAGSCISTAPGATTSATRSPPRKCRRGCCPGGGARSPHRAPAPNSFGEGDGSSGSRDGPRNAPA